MITSKIRRLVVIPIGYNVTENGVEDLRLKNRDGSLKLLPIDQFPSQHFMQNEDGWVMNDIAAYERAQSDSLARAILQRCPVLADSSKDDGLTVDERLKEIIPASASSPAEFVQVSKHIASVRYSRAMEKQRAVNVREAKIVAAKAAAAKNPKMEDIQPDRE